MRHDSNLEITVEDLSDLFDIRCLFMFWLDFVPTLYRQTWVHLPGDVITWNYKFYKLMTLVCLPGCI